MKNKLGYEGMREQNYYDSLLKVDVKY